MSSNKQAANFFTREEDRAILDFISKDNRILFCGGNQIWKKAESEGVCPGRSFWSIKERFRKTILKNLGRYNLDEETRLKISGFTKASAEGKAKLRFELAKPEDYEYLHSGEGKDKSDNERSPEEEEEEEEMEKGQLPREKRRDTVPEKTKDTVQESTKNTITENSKSPKKLAKEPALENQKSLKKNVVSNASTSTSSDSVIVLQKNSDKNISSAKNKEDSPKNVRRSQRNTNASPPKSNPEVPKKVASPKKASPNAETKKQEKVAPVKKTVTPEKKKKVLATKKKQLKTLLKNL